MSGPLFVSDATGIPLARVVAVVLALSGGRLQVGTGYLVSRRLVLTAEHCTRDKVHGETPSAIQVIRASDGSSVDAKVQASSLALDVAVLELSEAAWLTDVTLPRFGRVDRTRGAELADCSTIGFPSWQYDQGDFHRNTAELHGYIRATDDAGSGFLVLRDPLLQTVAPPPPQADGEAQESPWGGLSGALVFYSGLALGVVVQHQPRQGSSAVRLIPFDRIASATDEDTSAVAAALELGSADQLPQASPHAVLAFASGIADLGRPFMVPATMGTVVERAELSRRLTDSLLTPRTEPGLVVALEGIGGCGKTTLARTVCRAVAVQDAFPGGILWATVGAGRREADLAGLINGLCATLMPGEAVTFSDPQLSGARLGSLLDDRESTLLVVDDVWDSTQLEPFLVAGGKSTRLVITRNRDVVPYGARQIEVGDMTYDETVAMLTRQVDGLTVGTVDGLVKLTGRWPVLVSLVNGALAGYSDRPGASAEEAAAWITERLRREGPSAFDRSSRERAVAATVQASLELLADSERQCYLDLAILRGATDIGADVLGLLWVTSGRLPDHGAANRLQERITDLRLADGRWQAGSPAIRLHDVIREYLRHYVGAAGLATRNGDFVGVARQVLGGAPDQDPASRPWWSLPPDADYLWQNLAYHLHEAGADEELAMTVSDLRWAEAKINVTGSTAAVEADLALVDSDTARLLARTLGRSSSLLTPTEPRGALGATLVSRLDGIPGLESLVRPFAEALGIPRIANRWVLPDQPDPALIRDLVGHTDWIWSCSFSPDGKLLVTGGSDQTVRIWDVVTGQLRTRLVMNPATTKVSSPGAAEDAIAVTALAFSPDGTVLVTGGYDRTARVWEADTGRMIAELAHDGWIRCCAFSPDGTRFATAGDDQAVRVWEMPTARLLSTLQGHAGPVRACVFLADASLVTASDDGTVRRWDLSSHAQRVLVQALPGIATACALSASGSLIATVGENGTVSIWEVTTGAFRGSLEGLPGPASACAFSPGGDLIAATSGEGGTQVLVWETSTGRLRAICRGHLARVQSCAFSPDSSLLATAGLDGIGRIWELRRASVDTGSSSHQDWVRCCAFSPDGTLVLTGSDDRTARIWDAATGELRLTLANPGTPVSACAWSATGQVITGDFSGVIRVYDASSGRGNYELTGFEGPVFACAISADSSQLVAASADRTARIWDLQTRQLRACLSHDNWVYGCAFSPDGSLVATAGDDRMIRVWKASPNGGSAECVAALRVALPLLSCAWQPAGDMICAGGRAGIYGFMLLDGLNTADA